MMLLKKTKIFAAMLCFVFVCAVSLGATPAFAGPWSLDTAELDISDQVLVGTNQQNKVVATVRGIFFYNYGLAISASPQVLIKRDGVIALAPGATMVSQGRMERDGAVTVEFTVPGNSAGKIYVQAFTTKRLFGDRDANLSPIKVVTLLKDLLGSTALRGEKGAAGLQGLAGATGAVGPQGARGDTGATGLGGAAGAPGPAGAQGLLGLTGGVGSAGAQGEKGQTGSSGLTGQIGATGATGAGGPQGLTGAIGPAGAHGDRGAAGISGAAGASGAPGERGLQGEAGASGPAGVQGAKGEKGDAGTTGSDGAQGAVGPQGIQGATGLAGTTGATGERGLQGVIGAQGLNGDKGETGAAGANGAAGPQGVAGARGDSGPQGPAGALGIAGVTPQMSCPAGWLDLGPTCMQPDFSSVGTVEQAINACYQKGARVCEHQDLAYACSNRASLNLAFPDDTWLLTGSVILRPLGTSSSYVAYTAYRRVGARCFGPSTVNPVDGVVSYDLSTTSRNYTCCAERSF